MDGQSISAPSSILSVDSSKDLEGHADITLHIADKDITFQVSVFFLKKKS